MDVSHAAMDLHQPWILSCESMCSAGHACMINATGPSASPGMNRGAAVNPRPLPFPPGPHSPLIVLLRSSWQLYSMALKLMCCVHVLQRATGHGAEVSVRHQSESSPLRMQPFRPASPAAPPRCPTHRQSKASRSAPALRHAPPPPPYLTFPQNTTISSGTYASTKAAESCFSSMDYSVLFI